jgi:hypothetical protein
MSEKRAGPSARSVRDKQDRTGIFLRDFDGNRPVPSTSGRGRGGRMSSLTSPRTTAGQPPFSDSFGDRANQTR